MSVFCRHNRFMADCPICSKGTVLDTGRRSARPASQPKGARRPRAEKEAAPAFSGPHVAAGPYTDADGAGYVVRLERVPGGIRLAEWSGSQLRRRAPVLESADLAGLVAGAGEVLQRRDADALAAALATDASDDPAGAGVSPGRSGDFKEELRVEPLQDGRLRIARWVLRPGRGWEVVDAPPMLPAARYAQALAGAARAGLLAVSDGAAPARP